jgi:hypothetical protein
MKTPVAVFSYNRPEHTNRAIDALSKCHGTDACEFYFFSDGPRSDAALSEVNATRSVLREWAKVLAAHVIEQPNNLGLAKSIVGGVSDLCARYGRVIVVEDDLIVSPDFLSYMIQSLDLYKNDAQVMQVGGFTISPPEGLTADAFLLPVTTTWGWGTWQRAWQSFAWLPKDLDVAKKDRQWRDLFDLHGAGSFTSMLEDRLAGRNDSWGILWWYAVSRSNGLVLYPRKSLVWNGGFDGSGIHCGSDDFLQQGEVSNYSTTRLSDKLSFPTTLEYLPEHLAKLEEFFLHRQLFDPPAQGAARKNNPITAIVRKIKEKFLHVIR